MDNWRKLKLSGMKALFFCIFTTFGLSTASAFDFYEHTFKVMNDLNEGDSVKFFSHFDNNATFFHVGDQGLEHLPLYEFAPVLNKFKEGEYREEFTQVIVRELETGLTYVDVSFNFYINEKLSFSGIDHVVYYRSGDTFKIISLYSGALKPKFTNAYGMSNIAWELDLLVNKWHSDVATINKDAYFQFMSEDFIFLGTDPTERWTKQEFYAFCLPFFEKGETWTFKPLKRSWYINDNEDVAWFEESLETWMDECRGSGVLIKEKNQWKIAHYNLTVLIENDKIDKFIKLRKK